MGTGNRVNRKTWNTVGVTSVSIMVLMTLFAGVMMLQTTDDNLPFNAVVTMVFDITCMCVCIILMVTTIYDHRMNIATVYFMALVMLDCLMVFFEFLTWILDGNPDHVLLTKLTNYYVYGFIQFVLVAYWLYLRQILPVFMGSSA